jgi:3-hydroxyisobutyrate dehydrogenase-like beta-hydroxyacid dehydrogenase
MNSGLFQMVVGGAVAGEADRMKFFVSNACKDITYFTHLAADAGLESPIAATVRASIERAVADGYGANFMTGLLDAQLARNGLPTVAWNDAAKA